MAVAFLDKLCGGLATVAGRLLQAESKWVQSSFQYATQQLCASEETDKEACEFEWRLRMPQQLSATIADRLVKRMALASSSTVKKQYVHDISFKQNTEQTETYRSSVRRRTTDHSASVSQRKIAWGTPPVYAQDSKHDTRLFLMGSKHSFTLRQSFAVEKELDEEQSKELVESEDAYQRAKQEQELSFRLGTSTVKCFVSRVVDSEGKEGEPDIEIEYHPDEAMFKTMLAAGTSVPAEWKSLCLLLLGICIFLCREEAAEGKE